VAEAIHCGPIAHMTSAANSRSETRMTIHLRARVSSTVLVIVTSGLAAIAQQTSDVQQLADPDFKPTIEKPAYVTHILSSFWTKRTRTSTRRPADTNRSPTCCRPMGTEWWLARSCSARVRLAARRDWPSTTVEGAW
jgi:hypothetical protein